MPGSRCSPAVHELISPVCIAVTAIIITDRASAHQTTGADQHKHDIAVALCGHMRVSPYS
jgi:hypothetical protein